MEKQVVKAEKASEKQLEYATQLMEQNGYVKVKPKRPLNKWQCICIITVLKKGADHGKISEEYWEGFNGAVIDFQKRLVEFVLEVEKLVVEHTVALRKPLVKIFGAKDYGRLSAYYAMMSDYAFDRFKETHSLDNNLERRKKVLVHPLLRGVDRIDPVYMGEDVFF